MKRTKPLKTKLLKIVRTGITLKAIDVCGIPMFAIDCNISKVSLPQQTITKLTLAEAKQLTRIFRLYAAKELFPKKNNKKTKDPKEITV